MLAKMPAAIATLVLVGATTASGTAQKPTGMVWQATMQRQIEEQGHQMAMRMDKQQGEIKALQSQVESLTDQVGILAGQSAKHQTKIDRCEANASFAGERRRAQQSCGTESVESMLSLCCDSGQGNGHRRGLQAGCAALPASCTAQCAAAFVPVFEGCRATPIMAGMSKEEMDEWGRFYGSCQEVEQASAAMLQPVEVKMFKVLVSSPDAAQAESETNGGVQLDPSAQHLGPLPELAGACFTGEYTFASCCNTRNGKRATGDDDTCWAGEYTFEACGQSLPGQSAAATGDSGGSGATDVEQYHAECTTQNIMTCVPACNADHHGYELLATIDGTDTQFSCSLAHTLYSWLGAASLGGYLGADFASFFSAVVSGAAGSYIVALTEDAGISTDVTIQPGQIAHVSGDPELAMVRWGSGGVIVAERGSFSAERLAFEGHVVAREGGILILQNVLIDGTLVDTYSHATGGTISTSLMAGDYTGHAQCLAPYEVLDQAWRGDRTGDIAYTGTGDIPRAGCDGRGWQNSCYHCDNLADHWYRFSGAAGNAIATSPYIVGDTNHQANCGSAEPGWMTDSPLGPDRTDVGAENQNIGTYPSIREGVVQKNICFMGEGGRNCQYGHLQISMINCGGYHVYKLPTTPRCPDGPSQTYCTTVTDVLW
jgi:hypothetical protein